MTTLELLSLIFGVIGIIGAAVTVFALLVYYRHRKPEPKIIQVFYRKMNPKEGQPPDTGDRLVQVLLSNVGSKHATGCSAAIYEGDNRIAEMYYAAVDSPLGTLHEDWPRKATFTLYSNTPVMVRNYLDYSHVNRKFNIRLFRDGKKVHVYDEFTLP